MSRRDDLSPPEPPDEQRMESAEPVSGTPAEPTGEPVSEPTGEPTAEPVSEPTGEPASEPTAERTAPATEVAATFDDITSAERALARLGKRGFPTEHATVVAAGPEAVEYEVTVAAGLAGQARDMLSARRRARHRVNQDPSK